MAIPQYREVIKLNPNDAIAHANLGCALAEQGKFEPAVQSYKEALRLNPQDAEIHLALGGVYETKGRTELAMREYQEAVQADPESRIRPHSSRVVDDGKGATGRGHGRVQPRRESQPGRRPGLYGIGRIYAAKGKRETAAENFSKAIRLEKIPPRKTTS